MLDPLTVLIVVHLLTHEIPMVIAGAFGLFKMIQYFFKPNHPDACCLHDEDADVARE